LPRAEGQKFAEARGGTPLGKPPWFVLRAGRRRVSAKRFGMPLQRLLTLHKNLVAPSSTAILPLE
jgi:hypothetical protein